jgi:hypothetical protein
VNKKLEKKTDFSVPVVVKEMLALAGGKNYVGDFNSSQITKELKRATTRDEVYLQVVMLIGLGRVHGLYYLVLEYAKQEFLTHEDVKNFIIMAFKSNPHNDSYFDLFLRAEDCNGNPVFSVEEAWRVIKELYPHTSAEGKYRFYESFRGVNGKRKVVDEFPLEILKEWVVDGMGIGKAWRADYGKYTAIFAIRLYERGDNEIITPKNLAVYMERIASVSPRSHGIHRLLNLLGYGSQESERHWDLSPYRDLFATTLFKVFMGEVQDYIETNGEVTSLPFSIGFMLEALDELEDKDFVDFVKMLLDVQIANTKRNIEKYSVLLRKKFKKSVEK